MIAQNQMCFLKFQRILMAKSITHDTMYAARPASALLNKVKRRNTGSDIAPILRPV
jgi:hypothetical protein